MDKIEKLESPTERMKRLTDEIHDELINKSQQPISSDESKFLLRISKRISEIQDVLDGKE